MGALEKGPLHVNHIARKLSISPSQAQKWLKWLYKNKIVLKRKGDMRRLFYYLNLKYPKTIILRKYLFAEFLEKSRTWNRIIKKWPCGIFGSYAQGTFDSRSDLDIWVYSDKNNYLEIRKHVDRLAEELHCEGNIVFLSKKQVIKLKKSDPEFYFRLKLLSITGNPEVFNVT